MKKHIQNKRQPFYPNKRTFPKPEVPLADCRQNACSSLTSSQDGKKEHTRVHPVHETPSSHNVRDIKEKEISKPLGVGYDRTRLDKKSAFVSKRDDDSIKRQHSADETRISRPRSYDSPGRQYIKFARNTQKPAFSTNSAHFQRKTEKPVIEGLHTYSERSKSGASLRTHCTRALDRHQRNDDNPTGNRLQQNEPHFENRPIAPCYSEEITESRVQRSRGSLDTTNRRTCTEKEIHPKRNRTQSDRVSSRSNTHDLSMALDKGIDIHKYVVETDKDSISTCQMHAENGIEYTDGCRPKTKSSIQRGNIADESNATNVAWQVYDRNQSMNSSEMKDDEYSNTRMFNNNPTGYGFPFLRLMENNDASYIAMELTKKEIALRKCIERTKSVPELMFLFLKVVNKAFGSIDVPTSLCTLFEILTEEGFFEAVVTYLIDLQSSSSNSNSKDTVVTLVTQIMTNQVGKNPMSINTFGRLFTILKMIVDDPTNSTCIQNSTRKLLNEFTYLKNAYRKYEKSVDSNYEGKPPDDFRTLPVLPTIDEIKGFIKPFLRKNKLDQQYEDINDYLDVQFRLLREDFVGPLRDGITQYIKHSQMNTAAKTRSTDVRIYRNVNVVGPELTDHGLCFKMKMKMTPDLRRINWDVGKRLIYGSLVCLSDNDFDTLLLASVITNNKIEEGIFTVLLEDENIGISDVMHRTFTMAESTVYFESYKHVLSGLQSFDENNFAFAKYIVHCQIKCSPPSYIDQETSFDLMPLICHGYTIVHHSHIRDSLPTSTKRISKDTNSSTNAVVKVLDKKSWPPKEKLNLDDSQMRAVQNALSREFAIIQGPPGTGKTYVGLKLAKVLLHNKDTWENENGVTSPMLIVCYTNHALDQFLEGIVKFYKGDLVRVGGRSKSEILQSYALKQYRWGSYSANSAIGKVKKRKELEKKDLDEIEMKINRLSMKIQVCLKTIVNERILSEVISDRQYESLVDHGENRPDTLKIVANWLRMDLIEQDYRFETQQGTHQGTNDNEENENGITVTTGNERSARMLLEDVLPDLDKTALANLYKNMSQELSGYHVTKKYEFELLNRLAHLEAKLIQIEKEIQHVKSNKRNMSKKKTRRLEQLTTHEYSFSQEKKHIRVLLQKERNFRRDFKNMLQNRILSHDLMTDQEANAVEDIWQLNVNERWRLYRRWVRSFCDILNENVENEREKYKVSVKRYKEAQMLEDREILRHASVIGMTTTCAAKYLNTLRYIKPPIVIVEEAAEVLEAHIITTLSDGCKHLILIGDHKQLRPNPSVYKLAVRYNLNISLFERMVKNGVLHDCLELQHRMRPEIANIMRHIYPGLLDHNHVRHYANVKGVAKNVMFINHNQPETSNGDLKSYANHFEADYVAKLAKHFLLQGYTDSQITVLTTYTGQLLELKRRMSRNEYCNLTVTVVDNYQGEENDIVILTLVRSNNENRIGFMKTENRICVALSRAKMGFYVVGNFDHLSNCSPMWKTITEDMKTRGCVASGLKLRCANHPNDTPKIAKTASDFLDAPLGGCTKFCQTRLPCGHVCPQKCHIIDHTHEVYMCQTSCQRYCERNHPCAAKCYEDPCPQCLVFVTKTIPKCGHLQEMECCIDPSEAICKTRPCPQILECGHPCANACGDPHTKRCDYEIKMAFPCGHTSKLRCWQKHVLKCPHPCAFLLKCDHKCSGSCGSCLQGRLHDRCKQSCERILICGHLCKSSCAHCLPCTEKCKNRCVHSKCRLLCGIPCTPCKEKCKWSCEHYQCSKLCSEPCDRPPCNEPCIKKLKCGHDCIGLCGEPCPALCKICDKDEVTEILFGTEELPDARFVELDDCGHVIESSGLDHYMNMEEENRELCFKCCPKCKTPIRKCVRYGDVVNKQLKDIEQVKMAMLGSTMENLKKMLDSEITFFEEKSCKRHLRLKRFSVNDSIFNSVKERAFKSANKGIKNAYAKLFQRLLALQTNKADIILSTHVIQAIHIQVQVIHQFETFFETSRYEQQQSTFFDEFVAKVAEARFFFTEQELEDINTEIDRAKYYTEYIKLQTSLTTIGKHSEASEEMKELSDIIFSMESFTVSQKDEVCRRLETMKEFLKARGLKITEEERISIIKAMKLNKGHWFKCPNGHVYAIGDCGGANQRAKCPECKADIGGENHRLTDGNQLASEMDEAPFAAYSEEANNLANFNLDNLH